MRFSTVAVSILSISVVPVLATAASIEHKPVGCVAAEKFPRLEARVTPADSVARARVFFRAEGSPAWYSVAMTRQADVFATHLPKPKKSLAAFSYYIEAADNAMTTSRTEERVAKVVDGAGECQADLMGLASTVATVLLEGPAGAAAIPAGFSSVGVVAAGAQTASAAGAAGAASGGGGGLGAAAIVGGGALVAGGVGVVAATSAGSGDETEEEEQDRGGGGTLYQVTFANPGIDVSICVGRPLGWCCQAVFAKPDGTFDDTWSARDPGTARVTGTLTPATFTATIRCTNGAASGTLNATGSGGTYAGTFDFAGQRGSITVGK